MLAACRSPRTKKSSSAFASDSQRAAGDAGDQPAAGAWCRDGATLLENANGTAPGLWIEHGRTAIVLLPGPPREMKPMFEAVVRDRLAPRSGGAGLFRRVLKITGRTESDVDATAQPIYGPWAEQDVPISTTILAVLGQIELHLTARAADRGAADRALDPAVRELQCRAR